MAHPFRPIATRGAAQTTNTNLLGEVTCAKGHHLEKCDYPVSEPVLPGTLQMIVLRLRFMTIEYAS